MNPTRSKIDSHAAARGRDRAEGQQADVQSANDRSPEQQRTLARMKRLAYLMDSAFVVPIIRRRIGLDSLLGLLPVVGDVATAAASIVIVQHAVRMGMRNRTVARMLANIGFDMLIGLIPIAGDVFDMAIKANTKNVELMEAEIDGGRVIMSIK